MINFLVGVNLVLSIILTLLVLRNITIIDNLFAYLRTQKNLTDLPTTEEFYRGKIKTLH